MIARLISKGVRIINSPLVAIEKLMDPDESELERKRDAILSAPLESLAEALEEVDE